MPKSANDWERNMIVSMRECLKWHVFVLYIVWTVINCPCGIRRLMRVAVRSDPIVGDVLEIGITCLRLGWYPTCSAFLSMQYLLLGLPSWVGGTTQNSCPPKPLLLPVEWGLVTYPFSPTFGKRKWKRLDGTSIKLGTCSLNYSLVIGERFAREFQRLALHLIAKISSCVRVFEFSELSDERSGLSMVHTSERLPLWIIRSPLLDDTRGLSKVTIFLYSSFVSLENSFPVVVISSIFVNNTLWFCHHSDTFEPLPIVEHTTCESMS